MDLERERRMVFPLRGHVGQMCFLGIVERPEVHVFPVRPDGCLPFSGAEKPSAHESGSVVTSRLPLVVAVVLRSAVSKIAQTVVGGIAVYMVNVAARPNAVDIKPCKAMLSVLPARKADGSVSLRLCDKASLLTSDGKLVARHAVREDSSFWVVVQNLFQSVLRDNRSSISHVIAPLQRRFGQRIEGADNAFFPRLNIRGIA